MGFGFLTGFFAEGFAFFFFTAGFAGAAGVSGAALGAAGAGVGVVWADTGAARKAVATRTQTRFLIIDHLSNQPRKLRIMESGLCVNGEDPSSRRYHTVEFDALAFIIIDVREVSSAVIIPRQRKLAK